MAHQFFDAPRREVTVSSAIFGRTRISLVTRGNPAAPPLLLVHGLMTTGYSWRYVLDELATSHHVLVPDLPGCGHSAAPAHGSYAPEALGVFLGELQRTLGIDGCRAVGNSLGAMVCLRRMLDAPAAFSRLVLLHPPIFPMPRLYALWLALRVPGVTGLLGRHITANPLRWAHTRVHYHDDTLKSLEEAQQYGHPLTRDTHLRSFIRYLAETTSPFALRRLTADLTAGLLDPADAARILLVYGDRDRLVPPDHGPRLH
ncbi:alpha/beta fold hydrolase, partial [Nocardia blacklockiae]|uniref:alpha/beta fold hydrolase n=1 Tax=Nocardia blacklockiae TaxID=480036 RepID=UPI002B4B6688